MSIDAGPRGRFLHFLVRDVITLHTEYIPGLAAPGYLLMKMTKIVLLTSRAVIGLGGHQSKKMSIWRFLNFSRWFLKEFMLGASTASWERLFHLFMLRWEKKWWRISDWWCDFVNFQLWPRVLLVIVGRLKNCVQETAEKPLTILKSSIRSALLRRSSRDHNPSLLSLSLYGPISFRLRGIRAFLRRKPLCHNHPYSTKISGCSLWSRSV